MDKDHGKQRKKNGIWRAVNRHIRRLALELLSLILDHDWLFRLIGILNRRWGFLNTVFLMYPANFKYCSAYVYEWRRVRIFWEPKLVGLFCQNGRLGLSFVVSSTEDMFHDQANFLCLKAMFDRMEQIRIMLGAERKAFAGRLPSVLHSKNILTDAKKSKTVVRAVRSAIQQTLREENMPKGTPIVILGGKGLIGQQIAESLSQDKVYVLDRVGNNDERQWPKHLQGERILLVNIASAKALGQYFNQLWPEIVILNEAYPEPPKPTINRINEIGCHLYHIAGIKAWALPKFPGAYGNALPCCAAWPAVDMAVKVIRL